MALSQYYLVMVLREAGSDTGTTRQSWTITAATVDEAVELARHYSSRLPSGSVHSATLTEPSGKVICWMQNGSMKPGRADEGPPQRDRST